VGISVFCPYAGALQDNKFDLRRSDSRQHAAVAFTAGSAMTEFFVWRGHKPWKACLYASWITAAAAVFKEAGVDKFASGNDLISDGIGIAASGIFQYTVRF